MIDEYIRNATVVRVIDGDTIVMDVDLGFSISTRQTIRVLGVNCPEMHGATKEAGLRAKECTVAWLMQAGPDIQIRTILQKEKDSFRRILADVCSGRESLSAALLSAGHAIPFHG